MIKLKKADLNDFNFVYNEYMLRQFPQSELKSYEEFVKLLCDDGDFYHLYIVEDDNDAVAYVLLYKDEFSGFLWIDYIAVFPEYYSKGYGRKIIAELKNTFSKSKGVYFEVEKPDNNSPDTLRRIKFYTSCGVKKLDCEYFYPNKDGCLPMDLYFLPIKNELLSKDKVLKDISSTFKKLHSGYSHISDILQKIN